MPNVKFITIENWMGLNTTQESNSILLGKAADILGCDLRSGKALASERGFSLFGNFNQTTGRLTNSGIYEKRDGTQIPWVCYDNGTNAALYYLNTGDIRNIAEGEWLQLVGSWATGDIINMVGANSNTADLAIFGNGTQNFSTWNGAIAVISSTTATTITKTGSTTWAGAGFSTTGSIVINGTTYTYTGGSGTTTLTGVSADPTGEANGSGVAQLPDTSTYSSLTKGNIMLVADGRLWIVAKNSVRLNASVVGDATDFTSSTTPDSALLRDFPDVGGRINAIGNLGGTEETIWVLGNEGVAYYKLEYPTSTTRISKSKTFRRKGGNGCISHFALTNVLDDIWYVNAFKGVVSLSAATGKDGFDTDFITEDIRATMKDFEFGEHASGYTSAQAVYFDKEKRFLLACRSSSDVVDNDKVIDVQLVKNVDGTYRKEINLFDWNVGGWFEYGSDLYFVSSTSPEIFKGFDGYEGGSANVPIRMRYITKRLEDFGENLGAFNEKRLQYIAFTGLMGAGTTINFKIFFDELGIRATHEATLAYTETDSPTLIYDTSILNLLGALELGTNPLGGLTEDTENLQIFRVFFVASEELTFYNMQVQIEAEGSGMQFKIERMGLAISDPQYEIPDLRKKSFS